VYNGDSSLLTTLWNWTHIFYRIM